MGDSEASGEDAGEFLGIRLHARVRHAESHWRSLAADFLSPLFGGFFFPTAYAVGRILSPLRGSCWGGPVFDLSGEIPQALELERCPSPNTNPSPAACRDRFYSIVAAAASSARLETVMSGWAAAAFTAPTPGRAEGRFTHTVARPSDCAGTTSW